MTTAVLSFFSAIIIVLIMERISGWWTNRIARNAVDRALHPEKYPERSPTKLNPESRYIVRITDEAVTCERPDGNVEEVFWNDLQQVQVLNTDDGPWLPDVFWVLHGTSSGCVIPWGATNEQSLLKRLQQLPGFDNSSVINASANVKPHLVSCWQRIN